MKIIKLNYAMTVLVAFLMIAVSCERKIDELELATYPTTPEVFIDDFSSGLYYSAYGTSKVTAFSVDNEVKYKGTSSMKFEVPDAGDPNGSYVGGVFGTNPARDLSAYNVLTFWAKASQPVTLGEVGFGNDMGASRYKVSISNVAVNSNWTKFYVPMPDPSLLKMERGMFYYVATPQNGKGYTFWIDEVRFEKLGTIAHSAAGILNGRDSVINNSEIGDINTISGIYATFNLPTGIDQKVDLSGSYFTFTSSRPEVAAVNDLGIVTTADKGSAVITAKVGENVAKGSFTINSVGQPVAPAEPAPVPAVNKDNVISLFSNAYTNVKVDSWNTHWQYSTAQNSSIQVKGDDVIRYRNLNFVGIEFTSQPVDAGAMTHFHMDIWTPDVTAGKTFKLMLVDFGSNGIYGGGDDSSSEISVTSPALTTQNWVSIDVPLKNFTQLKSKSHLAQMVLSGDLPNVYIDNVYFYNLGSAPVTAAPVPTTNAADVISVFSDTYINLAGTNFNPNWGQATVTTQVNIAGNNTLKLSGLNYQGINIGSTDGTNQDLSAMSYLHLDFWSNSSTSLNVYLISPGPNEKAFKLSVPTEGWTSVDIPLSAFSGVDLKKVFQFKFEGDGNVFIDNIYFYKTGPIQPTEPVTAAPAPTASQANVVSIFSDAYPNVAGTDFNPNWGQSTVTSQVSVAGNNTLKLTGLNYQGIALGSNQDVSGMGFLHLDVWSANSTLLNVSVISPGPAEKAYGISVPTTGWTSVNIPLSAFSGVDLKNVFQLKFDGNGNIWIDNIYFYKTGGTPPTEPATAAPAPTASQANVISIFSDAYPNVAGTDFNPNWGQSTVTTQVSVAGNNTLKLAGLNYQGIALANNLDVSGMGYLRLDVWSANSTLLNVSLISPGPVEKAYSVTVPTSGWSSLSIPLSAFSGVDLKNVFQFKFDGNGNVWIDNIYFYKSTSGGAYSLSSPIDFESAGYGAGWTWNVFENDTNPALQFVANPDKTGANTSATVAKFTALKAGQPWAGCEVSHGAMGTFKLDANNCIVKIMVYKTVKSDVGIKFAKSDGWSMGEIKVANTVINEWQELTFNFTGQVQDGYDQIIIFPDFNARTSDNVIYFDHITFGK